MPLFTVEVKTGRKVTVNTTTATEARRLAEEITYEKALTVTPLIYKSYRGRR